MCQETPILANYRRAISMNDVCGALILLAFVACAYFLVRLIISFIKKGEKKYYAKRLAAAFAVVIAASIGFSMTQTPEQKAAYQAKREAQQKEAEEKKAAEEKAAADKKAADEKALAEKKKAETQTPDPKSIQTTLLLFSIILFVISFTSLKAIPELLNIY